ncbi:MAG: energy transducer TonB, partial [Methylophilus sp.]|nr:energy transducer TonB [Methylophilus sp.]
PATEATPNQEAKTTDKQMTEQTNSKVESQVSPQPQASTQAQANTQSAANFDTSQYFPVDKKAPAYPSRALDKGIQGACTVRYTVTTDGRVENPEALDDCHAFFIKPSLEATKSFRYTPRMVDGKAVKVPNVKNTFQYRIE